MWANYARSVALCCIANYTHSVAFLFSIILDIYDGVMVSVLSSWLNAAVKKLYDWQQMLRYVGGWAGACVRVRAIYFALVSTFCRLIYLTVPT
jgi:hypothetical protein